MVAPGNSDLIWVGHVNGMLFRTADGTASTPAWSRVGVTGPSPLRPRRYLTDITVDPGDPDTVYVAFGGFESDNLWVTRDEPCRATVDWLAERGILVAPGDFYGPAGVNHIRAAFTATDERIGAAVDRLTASRS